MWGGTPDREVESDRHPHSDPSHHVDPASCDTACRQGRRSHVHRLYRGTSGASERRRFVRGYSEEFVKEGESPAEARAHAERVYGATVGKVHREQLANERRARRMARTGRYAVVPIAVALAVVLSSLFGAIGTVRAATPMPTTFPTGLGVPTAPPTVGPQGPVGVLPALSGVGVPLPSTAGPIGHVGPVNVTTPSCEVTFCSATAATVVVRPINGTSPALTFVGKGAKVTLTNLTFTTAYKVTTNAAGYANFTVPTGWYLLNVTPSDSFASHMSYVHMVFLFQGLVVNPYLVPNTLWNPAVGNHPNPVSQVYVKFVTINPYVKKAEWPIVAQLWNWSANPHAIVATTVLENNETAAFSSVSDSYQYSIQVEAQANNYTATTYYFNHALQGTQTPSGATFNWNVNSNLAMYATDTTTGTLTGTAFPTAASPGKWSLGTNTAITGGTSWIGTGIQTTGSTEQLWFINAVVYLNLTYGGPNYNLPTTIPNLRCLNSTVVFLEPYGVSTDDNTITQANHCVLLGANYKPSGGGVLYDGISYMNWTYMAYMDGYHGSTGGAASWSNDYVWNVSGTSSGSVYPAVPTLTHDGFSNDSLDLDNSNTVVTGSKVDNSSFIYGLSSGGGNDNLNHVSWTQDFFGPHASSLSRGSNVLYGAVTRDTFSMGTYWNVTPVTSIQNVNFPSRANVTLDSFTVPNRQAATGLPIAYCGCLAGTIANNTIFGDLNMTEASTYGPISLYATGAGSHNDHNDYDAAAASFDLAGWEIGYNLFTDLMETTTIVGAWPTPNGATSGTFDNNTFGSLAWNQTFWSHLSSGAQGGSTDFALVKFSQFANVDHNDFKNALGGGGGGGPATDLIGPSMNVTYNAFENSILSAGSTYKDTFNDSFDFEANLQTSGGSQTGSDRVTGNWFENLSSTTAEPLFVASANAANLKVVLSTNSYYYSGPATGLPSTVTTLWSNGTLTGIGADTTYDYNTSVGTAHAFRYRVVPDVSTIGLNQIGYGLGLYAGTEPTLTLGGHKWNASVELTYLRLQADAHTAPQVAVVLTGLDPTMVYYVHGANTTNQCLFYNSTVQASGTGTVTIVYNPAASNSPLNVTYWASTSNGTSAGLFGLSSTSWTLILVGLGALGLLVFVVAVLSSEGRRRKNYR